MEKRGLGFFRRHKRGVSDDSRDGALSPTIQYSPPTPTSDTGPSVEDEHELQSRTSSPAPSVDPTIRPMSSPPTLGAANVNSEPAWPESDSSQIMTPPESLETPPRHQSFDKGEMLNKGAKAMQTPPDS